MPGGVFAQPSNMGNYDANHFAVVPEGDFSVGYAFCSWARVMIGYDILYISDVARPGSQIDSGVNVVPLGRRASGAAADHGAGHRSEPSEATAPAQSSFWAQGLTLGVELHF